MRVDRVRALISIALLVLLCLGILIFCLIYVADKNDTSSKFKQSQLEQNTSDSTEHSAHGAEHAHEHENETTKHKQEITTHLPPSLDQEYTIRLNRGGNASSGIVYIEQDDREGFVCIDGFDDADATVVCAELGFKHGHAYNNRIDHYSYTRYTMDEPILSHLNCTGREKRLSECDGFRLDNETECTWFTGVVCYNEDQPYELRLVNEIFPDAGMVEMRLGGEWGILCAVRMFDDELADILCRNMNYTGGLTLPRGELGPITADKLWVPYIHCDSSLEIKQNILECRVTLHTDNILYDHMEFRNNRYMNEYMACRDNPSFAASVQCLKEGAFGT